MTFSSKYRQSLLDTEDWDDEGKLLRARDDTTLWH